MHEPPSRAWCSLYRCLWLLFMRAPLSPYKLQMPFCIQEQISEVQVREIDVTGYRTDPMSKHFYIEPPPLIFNSSFSGRNRDIFTFPSSVQFRMNIAGGQVRMKVSWDILFVFDCRRPHLKRIQISPVNKNPTGVWADEKSTYFFVLTKNGWNTTWRKGSDFGFVQQWIRRTVGLTQDLLWGFFSSFLHLVLRNFALFLLFLPALRCLVPVAEHLTFFVS